MSLSEFPLISAACLTLGYRGLLLLCFLNWRVWVMPGDSQGHGSGKRWWEPEWWQQPENGGP